jgi:hypothetical protein
MSQTVTIDIIDDKALNLLVDLERQKLIRFHRQTNRLPDNKSNLHRFKGTMTKQSLQDIDEQLSEMRSEWE